MRGKERGFTQLRAVIIIKAAGAHEGQAFVDAVGQLLEAIGHRGVGNEVQVPLMHLIQTGKTALGEGAQQVQGGGCLVVCAQQALWVRRSASRVERYIVDDVAAVSG